VSTKYLIQFGLTWFEQSYFLLGGCLNALAVDNAKSQFIILLF